MKDRRPLAPGRATSKASNEEVTVFKLTPGVRRSLQHGAPLVSWQDKDRVRRAPANTEAPRAMVTWSPGYFMNYMHDR